MLAYLICASIILRRLGSYALIDQFLDLIIEDLFLDSQRLDPATDGRPDSRPTVRETVPTLGDVLDEFDFAQTPRAPAILPTDLRRQSP